MHAAQRGGNQTKADIRAQADDASGAEALRESLLETHLKSALQRCFACLVQAFFVPLLQAPKAFSARTAGE